MWFLGITIKIVMVFLLTVGLCTYSIQRLFFGLPKYFNQIENGNLF